MIRFPDFGGFASGDDFSLPPDEFREAIRDNSGAVGRRCDFVPSGSVRPWYGTMTGRQLDYFFWWRSRTIEGSHPMTDAGYLWLRACELINSPDDPSRVMDLLADLARSYRTATYGWSLEDTACEYGFLKGVPVPADVPGMLGKYRPAVIASAVCSYPVRDLPDDYISSCARNPEGRYYPRSGRAAFDLTNRALRNIDEHHRTRYGIGFARGTGETSWQVPERAFEGLSYWGPREFVLDEVEPTGPLTEFIGAVHREVLKALWRRDHPKGGPTVPASFPREFRDIVDRTVDDPEAGPGSYRYLGEGAHRGPFGDERLDPDYDPMQDGQPAPSAQPQVSGTDWLYDADPEDAMSSGVPVVIQQIGVPAACEEDDLKGSFDSHRRDEGDPAPYVPSGAGAARYGSMTPEQTAFYIGWRTLARRGEHGSTDQGYLRLYLDELITSPDPPGSVLAELDRLAERMVATPETATLIRRACRDYGMATGLRLPVTDPDDGLGLVMHAATVRLEAEPMADLDATMLSVMTGLGPDVIADDRFPSAMTAALRGVDSMLSGRGRGRLADMYPESPFTRIHVPFPTLCRGSERMDLRFRDMAYEDMVRAMRGVATVVLRRLGFTSRRVPKDLPEGWEEAAEAALDSWEEDRERSERLRRASEVILDSDWISSAEEDLDAVKGMMSTDDVWEGAAPVAGDDAPADGTLASLLTDDQKAYLRASLAGPEESGRVLERIGATVFGMEDSINAVAMDVLGDAIVEDGRAVEEYRDEISEAVG